MPAKGEGHLLHADQPDTGDEHEEEKDEENHREVVKENAVIAAQRAEQALRGKCTSNVRHSYYQYG